MNNNHYIHLGDGTQIYHIDWEVYLLWGLPFIVAIVMYIIAGVASNHRYKYWPIYRTLFWILGVSSTASVFIGPLANRAHMDFKTHMLGHLLLGMLAPLLIVLASPITLILRTLNVTLARRISHIHKSWLFCILANPIVTTLLNIGGLWILYTTDLYAMMHHNILLYLAIHFHVLFVGYLFTMSVIYFDPKPYRFSFIYRAFVLLIALSCHNILSKYIYSHPPSGVPRDQAEFGGILMYYGGDTIDIILIFILFFQWFKSIRFRVSLPTIH